MIIAGRSLTYCLLTRNAAGDSAVLGSVGSGWVQLFQLWGYDVGIGKGDQRH